MTDIHPAQYLGCNECEHGGIALQATICPHCGANDLTPYAVAGCVVHEFTEMHDDDGYCVNRGHSPDIDDENVFVMADTPTCVGCGCTDTAACDGGCYWVAPGLCSTCTDRLAFGHLEQLITDGAIG